MEPKFVDLDAFTVMGVLIHSMPDKVNFGAFWENEYMPRDQAIRPLSTDGAYYGVWFPHHGDGIPDYVAGMAVPDGAPVPEGAVARQVPASRYAVFECTMETIGATYGYVYDTWLPSSPYEFTPGGADFEYYPPQDATDASPAVYIPIRGKRDAADG
jgi:predicted transcriptional regulator YdeE